MALKLFGTPLYMGVNHLLGTGQIGCSSRVLRPRKMSGKFIHEAGTPEQLLSVHGKKGTLPGSDNVYYFDLLV